MPDLDVINFHNLINLQILNSNTYIIYTKFKQLRLISFPPTRESGYRISQLRNIKKLRRLLINGLEKIKNRNEAMKSNIKEKVTLRS